MDYNETPTKGFIMDRNEKITLALTTTVAAGSFALFVAARMKARKYIWNTKVVKPSVTNVENS